MTPTPTPGEERRGRRRVLAIFSAGLVVGVGVLSTLASWNTELIALPFPVPSGTAAGPSGSPTARVRVENGVETTDPGTSDPTPSASSPTPTPTPSGSTPAPGTFVLVGSVDGTTFTDHSTASRSAILGFSERASRLSPGDTVGAAFALRLSEVGAGVSAVNLVVTVSGAGDDLTFGMFTTAGFGCHAGTADSQTLIPAGTALGGTTTSVPAAMPVPVGGTEGDPVYVCVKVTAGKGLVPGSRHSAGWHFDATAG